MGDRRVWGMVVLLLAAVAVMVGLGWSLGVWGVWRTVRLLAALALPGLLLWAAAEGRSRLGRSGGVVALLGLWGLASWGVWVLVGRPIG